mmetsp:Transcript_31715/g.34664  ORF Transcript_31715/g.34664 Transcript_31715/m.34664 type:complete len:258 (-) Transcript_31715:196-969(-)|eukprot:CAMPEP_0173147766 /NCGR_PEP_ID=MMETSP1105-20130129/9325_1 /TAXON_ID=2985 /ORGANISM="Ochromonas sp., Strain BG-1" /LENGTH=257 /DNA_ID=CAMNT_0014062303 /DNA_START=161 /DNA_END=934 /DNA_ORIENTATION=+
MYSIEEATAEHEDQIRNEGENEHTEFNNHVIHRLQSFRPKLNKNITRAPSFFAKMFSSKKLNRVLPEEDEEEEDGKEPLSGDHEEEKEGEEAEDKVKSPRDENDRESDELLPQGEKVKKDLDEDEDFAEYPPMPDIGKRTNMDRLTTRNRTAEIGMNALMEMVNRDVDASLFDARHIPVGKDRDRVTVTQDISNYMNKVRQQKQIDKRVKHNMQDIQKTLNYRKSSIIIMNANYSSQLVRKIEPIYAQEARTIVVFK